MYQGAKEGFSFPLVVCIVTRRGERHKSKGSALCEPKTNNSKSKEHLITVDSSMHFSNRPFLYLSIRNIRSKLHVFFVGKKCHTQRYCLNSFLSKYNILSYFYFWTVCMLHVLIAKFCCEIQIFVVLSIFNSLGVRVSDTSQSCVNYRKPIFSASSQK